MTQVLSVSANTVATVTPEFLSQGKLATKLLGVFRLKEENGVSRSVCANPALPGLKQLFPKD